MSYGVPVPGARVEEVGKPSRRVVLVGVAALSLAACTGEPSSPPSDRPSPPEPDALLRGDVAAAERALLALYAATSVQHPTLAERLAPFAAHHAQHLAVVESSGPVATPAPSTPLSTDSPRPDSTGPAGGSPTADTTPTPAVPAELAAALEAVRAAERVAADGRIADCLRSEDLALAEILAAVAACEAAHDVLLGETT